MPAAAIASASEAVLQKRLIREEGFRMLCFLVEKGEGFAWLQYSWNQPPFRPGNEM